MRRWALAILGFAIGAGSAVGQSAYGPDEKGARHLCVRTISLHDLVVNPGVRLRLEREREVIEGASKEWPPCDHGADRCGPWDVRTGAQSEACFENVPPGDYFVSAHLEDFWGTRAGPIRVPVADFDAVQLRIGLDVVWSYRYASFLVGESPELGRARPFRGPGPLPGKASTAAARNTCVSAWNMSDSEELPGTWVTLEPWTDPSSRSIPTQPGETRAAPRGTWTGERGVACFPGVPPGRYLARAARKGFWDSAVGPVEVPVEDFEVRDVRVGIDLQWAGDVTTNLREGFTWP